MTNNEFSMIFAKINFKERNNPLHFDKHANKLIKNVDDLTKRIQTMAVKELSPTDKTNVFIARGKQEKFMSQLDEEGKKNFIIKKKLYELFSPYEKEEKILEEIFNLPNLSDAKNIKYKRPTKFMGTIKNNKMMKFHKQSIDSKKKEEMISTVIKPFGQTSLIDLKKNDSIFRQDTKTSFNIRNNSRSTHGIMHNSNNNLNSFTNTIIDTRTIPNLKSLRIKNLHNKTKEDSAITGHAGMTISGSLSRVKSTCFNSLNENSDVIKTKFIPIAEIKNDFPFNRYNFSHHFEHIDKYKFKIKAHNDKTPLKIARNDALKYLNKEKYKLYNENKSFSKTTYFVGRSY